MHTTLQVMTYKSFLCFVSSWDIMGVLKRKRHETDASLITAAHIASGLLLG